MPTGYTAAIVDGKELTFEEFAKRCMRAFGATIHMRDDSMDKEYEPREPSDYDTKQIEKLNKQLKELHGTSNAELKRREIKRISDSIHQARQRIIEKTELKNRLDGILGEVKKWNPPTDEHIKFKEFMIDQLQQTIDWDTNTSYYEDMIKLDEGRIKNKNIDSFKLRKEKMDAIKDSISYHENKHKEEVKRCKDSNEWVEVLINSL